MIKIVFTYNVAPDKQAKYLIDTAEIIKPFWESHGCTSYSVWQTDEGSPAFVKEMVFEDQKSREKASDDPSAKEVVGLFSKYATNVKRRMYLQCV
ncbi:MAG: hypothetical protein HN929_12315 [Chloroflexi bacterium]|jgi:hypothetical protein|nr:hypothetical protein [Chloroflexota bacterium]MBT7082224.1 hypothetical protein [Chloroflexota bacterium]MBT7290414.1 hypothetical protein [Chloroflexota bacterium]